jgi:hypothetical protein
MKKTFALAIEGKNPDRILEAVKHEIRKYLRRERRRALPEGVDFLDFDCRLGQSADSAEVVHLATLISAIDTAARGGATSVYVEILSKPGHRTKRPPEEDTAQETAPPEGAEPAAGGDTPPDQAP